MPCKARHRRTCLVLLLIPLSALSPGCGPASPAVGEVTGKVTFTGQPVSEGTVVFFNPETGFTVEAPLEQGGSYALKTHLNGVPVGVYQVTVTPGLYLDNRDPTTPPVQLEKKAPNIPRKYRTTGSTPLRADVKEGKNEINLDMLPD
jgi:hypothetical protein